MGKLSINIIATSDIHAPAGLSLLRKATSSVNFDADIMILAGDLIDRGKKEYYGEVLRILDSLGDIPKIAVFGNDEFDSIKEDLKKEFGGEIIFLDDGALTMVISGISVGIVGTKGSLERPTSWQRSNIPGISRTYEERISTIGKLISELKTDVRILVSHYAPTFRTLAGEDPSTWKFLGHRGYEEIIVKNKLSLVVHGHSHRGLRKAVIGSTPVYNVALPLWKELVCISISASPAGLNSFL